jgi:hypothetical protein
MTEQNANSRGNDGNSEQSSQGGSAQANRDSQSTYERGRYEPLPGQGPDYVQKSGGPHRTKE